MPLPVLLVADRALLAADRVLLAVYCFLVAYPLKNHIIVTIPATSVTKFIVRAINSISFYPLFFDRSIACSIFSLTIVISNGLTR